MNYSKSYFLLSYPLLIRKLTIQICIIFFFLCIKSETFAFTLNTGTGKLEGWNTQVLSFDYNFKDCSTKYSQDTLIGILDAALSVWNSVPHSSIRLIRGSAVSTSVQDLASSHEPSNPIIICDPLFNGSHGNPDTVPAETQITLDHNNGSHIIFATITINAKQNGLASVDKISESKLLIVLAHEIGHVLGLGHPNNSSALMYYNLSKKEQPTLSQDDSDGIAYLYPRNELFGNSPVMGCATTRSSRPHSTPSGPDLFWLEAICLISLFGIVKKKIIE